MMFLAKRFCLLAALASMAVLSARADEKEQPEHKAAQGTIKSVSPDQNVFTATDKINKEWTYHVTDHAKFFIANMADAKLSDLKAGQKVSFIWGKKGNEYTARAVLVQEGDFSNASLATGTVKRVATDSNELVVMGPNSKEFTYQMGDQAKIRLNDKEGKITDLKNNDHVIIAYDKHNGQSRVLAVCGHTRNDQ